MLALKRPKRDMCPFQKPEDTLNEMKNFMNKLNEYNETLVNLDKDLSRPNQCIYDACADLRRRIQLNKEEIIADIKIKNNFDIDTEESELNSSLMTIIDDLNKQSDTMIATIDEYEIATYHLFEKNESKKKQLAKELNKSKKISKHFVSSWKACLAEMNFDEIKMTVAVRKLNEYQLKLNELVKKVNLLLFANNILELKQHKHALLTNEFQLSFYIYFDQTRYFVRSKSFNFQTVLNLFKNVKLDFTVLNQNMNHLDKLSDGTYLIEFESDSSKIIHLVVFDPVLNIIKKDATLHFSGPCSRVFFKINKNLFALVYETTPNISNTEKIVIMDTNLDVLHEEDCFDLHILGADDSFIYTLSSKYYGHTVNLMDWDLKPVDHEFQFQNYDPEEEFYINTYDVIEQFSKKGSTYFVFSDSTMYIYDENFSLLNSIQTFHNPLSYWDSRNWPKFDSKHILFLNKDNNLLSYYDLCGNLVKCVQVNVSKLTNYVVDEHDQLYAYDSNFLYSLC